MALVVKTQMSDNCVYRTNNTLHGNQAGRTIPNQDKSFQAPTYLRWTQARRFVAGEIPTVGGIKTALVAFWGPEICSQRADISPTGLAPSWLSAAGVSGIPVNPLQSGPASGLPACKVPVPQGRSLGC